MSLPFHRFVSLFLLFSTLSSPGWTMLAPAPEEIERFFPHQTHSSAGKGHEEHEERGSPANRELRKIGDVYFRTVRFQEALQCYVQALKVDGLDEVEKAILYVSLGRLYYNWGARENKNKLSQWAVNYYNHALVCESLPADLREEAQSSRRHLLDLFMKAAHRLDAEHAYLNAAFYYEWCLHFDAWTQTQRVRILHRLAEIYVGQGEYDKAKSVYQKLLKEPEYRCMGTTHANLATLFYNEMAFEEARFHAERAIQSSDTNKVALVESHHVLALLLLQRGVEAARPHFWKCLELSESYEDRVGILKELFQYIYGWKYVQTDEHVRKMLINILMSEQMYGADVLPREKLCLLRQNLDFIEKEQAKHNENQGGRVVQDGGAGSSKKGKGKVKPEKKPTKKEKGKERMPSREDEAFKKNLKRARAQAGLVGDNAEGAEKGIARLADLMEDFDLKKDQRNQAREAWLSACKNLCAYYVAGKKYDRIILLFEGREEFLAGKSKMATWCRDVYKKAQGKTGRADQKTIKKDKEKEVVAPSLPPQQQRPGNPMRERRSRANSTSSEESSDGPSSSSRSSVSESTKVLIRQDSARLILESQGEEDFNAQEALALMVKKYGKGAKQPALQALTRARFMLERAVSRRSRKPSDVNHEQREYAVELVRSDLASEVPKEHQDKYRQILEELKNDPRKGVGKPKELKVAKGYWSRKLDKKHRMVYFIDDGTGKVTIYSVREHYKNMVLPKKE